MLCDIRGSLNPKQNTYIYSFDVFNQQIFFKTGFSLFSLLTTGQNRY